MPAAALALALLCLLAPPNVHADGKFYSIEQVPPGIPYQRALLLFDEGKQTLLLQSKFAVGPHPDAGGAFGWVVPVPTVPELGSLPAGAADRLFHEMDMLAQVDAVHLHHILYLVLLVGLPVAGVWCGRSGGRLQARLGGLCFVLLGLLVLWILTVGLTLGTARVTVLHEQSVGIYDAKVIHGNDSTALVKWLNENGFHFTAVDQPVLDGYIERGWSFVVARVKRGEEQRVADARDGLVDPLILRFASRAPVYPLALTGTTGTPTEVALYTLSHSKLDAGGVLPLRFAERSETTRDAFTRACAEPGAAWRALPWEANLPYLCKFKGTLRPERMTSDLVLVPSADERSHRERVFVW